MMINVQLLLVFLKIGLVGFGGGYAILALMYDSLAPFGLITSQEFTDMIAISQITPGPVAINMATYLGYLSDGWLGAIVNSIVLCLPGCVFMYLMLSLIEKGENLQIVNMVLYRVRIAGIVLLLTSGVFIADGTIVNVDMLKSSLFTDPLSCFDPVQVGIFVLSFIICYKKKCGPVLILVIMAAVSVIVNLAINYFM